MWGCTANQFPRRRKARPEAECPANPSPILVLSPLDLFFFWLAVSGWFGFLHRKFTLSKHILISLKALVLIVLSFQGSKFWQQNTQLFLWLVVTAKATVYLCPSSWQKWYMTSGGVYLLQTTELLLWILVTTKLLPAYLRCSYQCLHGLSFTAPNFILEKSILLIMSRSMFDIYAKMSSIFSGLSRARNLNSGWVVVSKRGWRGW